MLANVASNWFISGNDAKRYGNAHPNLVPYQTFNSKDGFFALAVGNDRQFELLCKKLGREDIAKQFPTNVLRVENRVECVQLLQEIFSQMTQAEIISLCNTLEIPAGAINSVAKAFQDPQTQAREMIVKLTNSFGAEIPTTGSPIKMSETPVSYHSAPPSLGEHTEQILKELGYNLQEIQDLKEKEAI